MGAASDLGVDDWRRSVPIDRRSPPSRQGLQASAGAAVRPVRLRELREAIRALAAVNQGATTTPAAVAVVHLASRGAELRIGLDELGRTRLEPVRGGVDGAVATLLGILHEARVRGDWQRLKGCRGCGYAFFDRSKNRSASWCAMSICGNRAKNRAYRQRRSLRRSTRRSV